MSIKRTLDKAINVLDASKQEGFDIISASVSGGKLYLVYNDLLYGYKNQKESFTKSEAAAFVKDPWNNWKGNTKKVVERFIGSKVL